MTITVPKNLLKAAFLFSSKDDARYILNTVQFIRRKTGVIITACDGRRILTIKSTETTMSGDQESVVIKRFRVPIRRPGLPPQLDTVEISSEKVRGRTVYVCDDIVIPEVTGEYPKWQQVFHGLKPIPLNSTPLNPEFLTDFGKAAKLIDGEPHVRMQTVDGGAVLVKGCNDSSQLSWRGLLMPLRGQDETPGVPEWISEL